MDKNLMKRLEIEDVFLETIQSHLPPRARKYTCYVIDTNPIQVEESIFFNEDPEPFEGEIIGKVEGYLLVQVGPKDYRIIDLQYVTTDIEFNLGCKVSVKPYNRRHFNGKPKYEYVRSLKPKVKQNLAIAYGHNEVVLPIEEVRCQQLSLMIDRMNNITGVNGYRTVTEILVDANAELISVVDPKPNQSTKVLPKIKLRINSQKLNGYLAISCDETGEFYTIQTFNDEAMLSETINITWNNLADNFIRLIDDGSWQKTIVEVLNA